MSFESAGPVSVSDSGSTETAGADPVGSVAQKVMGLSPEGAATTLAALSDSEREQMLPHLAAGNNAMVDKLRLSIEQIVNPQPRAIDQVRADLAQRGLSGDPHNGLAPRQSRSIADALPALAFGMAGPRAEKDHANTSYDYDLRRAPNRLLEGTGAGDASLTGANPMRDVGIHGGAGMIGALSMHDPNAPLSLAQLAYMAAGAAMTGLGIELSQSAMGGPGSPYDIARTTGYGTLFAVAYILAHRSFSQFVARSGSTFLGAVRDLIDPRSFNLTIGRDSTGGPRVQFQVVIPFR